MSRGTECLNLTLGSHVPSAYPAMCEIHREAEKKVMLLCTFHLSTGDTSSLVNNRSLPVQGCVRSWFQERLTLGRRDRSIRQLTVKKSYI